MVAAIFEIIFLDVRNKLKTISAPILSNKKYIDLLRGILEIF